MDRKLSYKSAVKFAKKKGYFFANKADYAYRRWPDKKKYYVTSLTNGRPGRFFYTIREAMESFDQSQDRIKQPDLYHSTSILSPFHS